MTLTFVGIEILFELAVAAGSAKIQPFLTKFGKRFNQVFGGVFIVIGIALPLRG
jgi:threonine/homoserine/homoserine lactone efflux protein